MIADTGPSSEPNSGPEREPKAQPGRGVSRRRVLKAIGIGGGAVVIAGAAGVGIRGETNGVWNQGEGAPYELWSTWQKAPGLNSVVAAGALAANPHNTQPWAFVVDQETIDVFADPDRIMPTGDPDGRERIAGFGCAIENMALAARTRGLDTRVIPWPDADPDHIARLELRPGTAVTAKERTLAEAISARHSNRGPYTSEAVDENVLSALMQDAPGGAEVLWITDPSRLADLGKLYVEATQAIVDDKQMSVEAFSWFHSDRPDVDRYRDGLTLDCQGLDGFTLFMAKILPAQSRTSGDEFWVKSTRKVHTATARAYGIIRVSDTADPEDRLAGGGLLEHLHLAATAAGLGMHHMNQITERIARDAGQGNSDRFGTRWSKLIGVPAAEGLLSFRIGHPERKPSPSPRRALDAVLKTR